MRDATTSPLGWPNPSFSGSSGIGPVCRPSPSTHQVRERCGQAGWGQPRPPLLHPALPLSSPPSGVPAPPPALILPTHLRSPEAAPGSTEVSPTSSRTSRASLDLHKATPTAPHRPGTGRCPMPTVQRQGHPGPLWAAAERPVDPSKSLCLSGAPSAAAAAAAASGWPAQSTAGLLSGMGSAPHPPPPLVSTQDCRKELRISSHPT